MITVTRPRASHLLLLGITLLAGAAQAQQNQGQAVDQIYRELMGQSPNAPGTLPPPSLNATPGQDARREAELFREETGRSQSAPSRATPPPASGTVSQDARREEQILRELTNPALVPR
ncbi:hypothetical protein KTR66_03890 [Roseococcus sp. SDR]|uniref:hypothetical protein n=1 Tax=Roseococcus sp. SDR TaxID=2835532 RepID=UPI001BD139D9|nr:hypothetical protein [Roseococcus sp. SDR]MBS7789121.1 hypothetical protein [Roseococcus sp. SDR]MBV1844435.1 hypothetical protein [Roseococcus sp. SDR]